MSEIAQLNQARDLAFSQPSLLPQVLTTVVALSVQPHLMEWCAQFFLDVFSASSQLIPALEKQNLSSTILKSVKSLIESGKPQVVKRGILCATNIYPMLIDLVAKTSNKAMYDDLMAVKLAAMNLWNNKQHVDIGSKIVLIRFMVQVVLVQTPGSSKEFSIAQVPDSHPIVKKQELDLEAKKTLELLLQYLVDEQYMETQMFTAILHGLSFIMKKRPFTATRVLNGVLKFNIDAKYTRDDEPYLKFKLGKRFVERCYKNFLNFGIRAGIVTQHPNAAKFQKIAQTLQAIGEEQKSRGILNNSASEKPNYKSAQVSYKEIYTLINPSDALANYDLSILPQDTLVKLCLNAIGNADTNKLITAVTQVATKYTQLMSVEPGPKPAAGAPAIKTEPEESPAAPGSLVKEEEEEAPEPEFDEQFILPPPEPFTADEKKDHMRRIIGNFMKLHSTPSSDLVKVSSSLEQVTSSEWTENTWLIMLTRLATRGVGNKDFANMIRQSILDYVLDEFTTRTPILIDWLNEEWYAEKDGEDTPVYNEWSLKTLDALMPSIEATHRRIMIPLMSELPKLTMEHISKLKSLCMDPTRSALGFQTIKFLLMFRPPVKEDCLELVKQLQTENEQECIAILNKYT